MEKEREREMSIKIKTKWMERALNATIQAKSARDKYLINSKRNIPPISHFPSFHRFLA